VVNTPRLPSYTTATTVNGVLVLTPGCCFTWLSLGKMAGGGHMSAVNWDNFRLIFGVYFLYQLYRLAVYFFRKPANLKGNFQVRFRV
jgi:hypothetical protein